MTEGRVFVLAHMDARINVGKFAMLAPEGWKVRFSPPSKSREQEERFHAMVGDVAEQWEFCGRRWDAESMKRLLVDQFRRDTAKDPELGELWKGVAQVEMAPSIDRTGVVALGWQTRRFSKKLYSAMIEWLFAFGDERGVRWTDPTRASGA